MKIALLLILTTIGFIVGLWYFWSLAEGSLSGHGWTALILGVVFSLVVGIGLMVLVFASSRRGHDEPPRFE
jgi:heme/copper-type cytochrome/quinol oxidase subunit 4